MTRFALCSLLLASSVVAQDPSLPGVTVPTFPNSTCPVMGKPVSLSLYTDTDFGRIYICCKGCDRRIARDVATAYKTAFPKTRALENERCPVTDRPIGESTVTVTLQGMTVRLCSEPCLAAARSNAQIVLTKATRPDVEDVKNTACPVTDTPIVPNTFVLIGTKLVRLSGIEAVESVRKQPNEILAKVAKPKDGSQAKISQSDSAHDRR